MNFEIQNSKIELIQWLTTVEDKLLIRKLLDLKKKEAKDWWNEISSKEKESIEQGIVDANDGKLTPHSEARKVYEKSL
jgi:hypothetical protein